MITTQRTLNDCATGVTHLHRSSGRGALLVLASCLVFLGVFGCSPPPGAVADGYASADVDTWYDADGDGARDSGEDPFPWITIQMADASSMTNSSGHGTVGVFKPGCARKCWKGEAVSVGVPPGYRATTPTEFALTGQGLSYEFGFQPADGTPSAPFPDQPGWYQAFLNRGLSLTAFHYSANDDRLVVSFDAASSSDEDAYYRDIFDVLRTLEKTEGISVEQLEITTLPSSDVATCDMSVVDDWSGKISPAEIVATRCQSR